MQVNDLLLPPLPDEDHRFLERIRAQLGIVADVSRAEGLLYGPLVRGRSTVLFHTHPHSVAPAYLKNYTGVQVGVNEMPVVVRALTGRRRVRGQAGLFGDGASVVVEAWPLFSPVEPGRVIGAVSIDTSLLEYERLRRRNRVFRRALRHLQGMLRAGLLENAESLSYFGELDGLVFADAEGVIRYTSGVAASLYRRIGYLDPLVNRRLEQLATHDGKLFRQALNSGQCVEAETEDRGRHWIRKAIPIFALPPLPARLWQTLARRSPRRVLTGVLLIVRDVTEERRQEQELRVKNAMIQEIHHRVKNNLQTIAALLRIQSRRVESEAAVAALQDAIQRILSVAVIHEYLSAEGAWSINIKEVCQRILTQTRHSVLPPESRIAFRLHGPAIWLPPRQATACALVINELVQNALEHGFANRGEGTITVNLTDEGDCIMITIQDDGPGLPDDFDPANLNSLGLQIAGTLVKEDLRGNLELTNNHGTTATITFPKATFGGEAGWNQNASS
ncbi:MAG: hypothetical protein D6796_11515 [Caldilineae bacterium]|nr:MAG: hypothetical protein D6796_11515 [Caldilineae bacterium]